MSCTSAGPRPALPEQYLLDLCADAAIAAAAAGAEIAVLGDPNFTAECLRRLAGVRVTLVGPKIGAVVGCAPTGNRRGVARRATDVREPVDMVLWSPPGGGSASASLAEAARMIAPGGRVYAVFHGPLARLRAPRVEFAGSHAGPSVGALRREAGRRGLAIEEVVGFQSPRSLAWATAARIADRVGRAELGDRFRFGMRATMVTRGPTAWLCPVGLLVARALGRGPTRDAATGARVGDVKPAPRCGIPSGVAPTPSDPFLAAALRAGAWLDTVRGPDGYSGPVVHWWQSCLRFTGAGLDWRYEGIVHGLLALFERTGDDGWLARARAACDDLVRGQLPDGRYRSSSFELNPHDGGTPHEAACDVALLRLALLLRGRGDPDWERYAATARRNLSGYYLARLWDSEAQSFRDDPQVPSFVSNKSATLAEALFLLAAADGDDESVVRHALPTLRCLLAHQRTGGRLDGAIAQNSMRGQMVEAYFPFYVARCVGGLLEAYRWTGEERWLDAACRAIGFVLRQRLDDGSFPQVVYGNGRTNRYPQWIAATGDILRVARLLAPFGVRVDLAATEAWLLRGQTPTGGFRTAHGFGSQMSQRIPGALPDFRDLMPCSGWVDKAFRWLAERTPAMSEAGAGGPPPLVGVFEAPCLVRGRPAVFHEDTEQIEIIRGRALLYRWRKGAPWAEVCDPQVDVK